MIEDIELNPQFKEAFDLLENTDKVIFVTGRAGTGKSTLLKYFRDHSRKRSFVLAPTGVAALNVQGQTIHSFFRFDPKITPIEASRLGRRTGEKDLFRKMEVMIIDEVSMVRADLLDCVDSFLKSARENGLPFGGVQTVFFGDLYQLPPVLRRDEEETLSFRYPTPFFFSSQVMKELESLGNFELVELEKIYRQEDEEFIEILNAIRYGRINPQMLARLNSRFDPDFQDREDHIVLTSTNRQALEINSFHLERLRGRERVFLGEIEGSFERKDLPTEVELCLKEGARVMFLVNDPIFRFVNGTLGTVVELGKDLIVETDEGLEVEIEPFAWEMYRTRVNPEDGTLEKEVLGRFIQIPLRLAWAITIHKSQGKTFPRVVIDLGRGAFAPGQVYVALSRCTSLEGIVLKKPIKMGDIRMDYRVVRFLNNMKARLWDRDHPSGEKVELIKRAIREGREVSITYLSGKGEESSRRILPISLEEKEYQGTRFLRLSAYCFKRKARRTFRLDRIKEVHPF